MRKVNREAFNAAVAANAKSVNLIRDLVKARDDIVAMQHELAAERAANTKETPDEIPDLRLGDADTQEPQEDGEPV